MEEATLVVTLTLNKKLLLFGLLSALMVSGVSADYYYGNSGGSDYTINGDTGFSVPQYDSQQEIITFLVLPFIFISVLLRYAFIRALHLTLADDNEPPLLYPADKRPDVSREATVMALAATGMLVPSPMWTYVRWMVHMLDTVVMLAFFGIVVFVLYLMSGR